jgi:PadR family transcriptional regulator PadR
LAYEDTSTILAFMEKMPRGEYLGEFEQMVLLAVTRLEGEAYGMSIVQELTDATGIEPAVASVYAALDRLERGALVASWVGAPTPERGGRAKRFFRLAPAGKEALVRSRAALAALWRDVDLGPEAQA